MNTISTLLYDVQRDGKRYLKNQKIMTKILTYGGGVNTIALAIEMIKREMPIDYILFSDTKAEKPETYEYIDYFNKYLLAKGYPAVIRLNPYREEGLYGECIRLKRMHSIVYGFKSCSEKWKIRPFIKYCRANNLFPATVYKGFDAGEEHRIYDYSNKNMTIEFPLVAWDIDRIDCVKIIIDEGLKLPPKSSCYFCPSMKRQEVYNLEKEHPELIQKAVEMERNAKATSKKVKGLMRNHSWEELLKQKQMDFDTSVSECQRCSF